MPTDTITDPHVFFAILAIAGAAVILFGLICLNMAASDRQQRREK
jgi:hypothetical protein